MRTSDPLELRSEFPSGLNASLMMSLVRSPDRKRRFAALRGLVLGIQAVTIPPGPKLQLSTPTVVVIR
jgi:hypothetical protein